MESGTLSKWHVAIGDEVASGDVIAEIETDKATMEVEAVEEGRIGAIYIQEGTTEVKVNSTIAMLLEEGEDESALEGLPKEGATIPQADSDQSFKDKTLQEVSNTSSGQPSDDTSNAVSLSQSGDRISGDRIIASPLAKRLANQNNLDLAVIKGSGPNGRIIKKDIEAAVSSGDAKITEGAAGRELAAPYRQSEPIGKAEGTAVIRPVSDKEIFATYEEGTYDLIPIDNMRRTVADRLTVAKTTIPHFYLSIDCELDQLLAARKRLNDNAPKEGPNAFKLSVNDFIIKAMALALQYVPAANSTWSESGILRHKRSDISVAVAVDGGLFTPVIRHADLKTLSEISNEMKDLAGRARSKKLSPADYVGGTTSISNLGMMGIKKFDAVINPPQSTILAIGNGEKRPVVIDDDIKIRNMMTVTLSCDHRVVDGALGAELLAAFKGFIEDPVTMLV
jgi:pyruvate dehydrogenase E2 component (dihydrolipoamide acetyltransferase)